MQNDSTSELFRIATDIWQEFMDRGEYHAAIESGIAIYAVMRAKKDDRLAQGALGLIHVSIDANSRTDGSSESETVCSFCGRGKPEVKLAAGANAFICDSCVETLSEVFSSKQGAI